MVCADTGLDIHTLFSVCVFACISWIDLNLRPGIKQGFRGKQWNITQNVDFFFLFTNHPVMIF